MSGALWVSSDNSKSYPLTLLMAMRKLLALLIASTLLALFSASFLLLATSPGEKPSEQHEVPSSNNTPDTSVPTSACPAVEENENQVVTVRGRIHRIVTIPEIRLPYNAVIDTGTCHIGVFIGQGLEDLKEGSEVTIVGIVKKGYVEKLSDEGWVKSKEVYFIVAKEIRE